jgi:hypothetical protein
MKAKYREACRNGLPVPIFSQPWWLDAVVGEAGWDVALVENGEGVVASMPFCVQRRLGMPVSVQPALTQVLGPWIADTDARSARALAREKKHMEALIDQLPRVAFFSQNWHYSRRNWLPFYWRGFKQTTRYTYVLPDLSVLGRIWNGTDQNIRTDIRKARDRFGLKLRPAPSLDDFLELNDKVFARQGKRPPYGHDLVRRLYDACTANAAGRLLIAEDREGRAHAGAFVVWDAASAYYLMGGSDPDLRNSGATGFCLWEAIALASSVASRFDFEGSMLEPVERFFRAFGAEQTPYFNVSRTSLRRWALMAASIEVWRTGR